MLNEMEIISLMKLVKKSRRALRSDDEDDDDEMMATEFASNHLWTNCQCNGVSRQMKNR